MRRLFATIADRYDFITGFLSYGQDRRWKRRLIALAALTADERLLDLACGTGDLVLEAAPRVRHAVGIDVTERMLQIARRRAARVRAPTPLAHLGALAPAGQPAGRRHAERHGRPGGAAVHLACGDMLALPVATAAFDVVTIGYGLRNVVDLPQALREIRRVLVPGGRLLSLDFNRPSNPLVRAVYLGYLTVVGAALGYALHGDPDTYRYIPESIRNYPGASGVSSLLREAGFAEVRCLPLLGGLMSLHLARRAP